MCRVTIKGQGFGPFCWVVAGGAIRVGMGVLRLCVFVVLELRGVMYWIGGSVLSGCIEGSLWWGLGAGVLAVERLKND